ncbi:hypothetical protein [Paenibacillus profundus]|nr:hypothetical protein [Paenibacillus profundus]
MNDVMELVLEVGADGIAVIHAVVERADIRQTAVKFRLELDRCN